ncbi:MAG: PD-(D/E)XK nuclease family protein [Bacteroidota bacterium]
MKIYYSLGLDEEVQVQSKVQGGIRYAGPHRLLRILETYWGFQGYESNQEHLRIEQYRQLLMAHIEQYPKAFYQHSFAADQMATATEMLSRRDELLLGGWNFEVDRDAPDRLQTFAELEAMTYVQGCAEQPKQENQIGLYPGFSDRFIQILSHLKDRYNPIQEIVLLEPRQLLMTYLQKLLAQLEQRGTHIIQQEQIAQNDSADLALFQKVLAEGTIDQKQSFQADGSLYILRCQRETDAATFLASLMRQNEQWKPHVLMTEKNRTLDNALIQEGLPSMGILSASLARPVLQIIKLAPAFLWTPIDPFKIMEFVNLKVKPLEEELAHRIAQQLAQSPGIGGEGWRIAVGSYFDALEKKASGNAHLKVGEIRQQYNFWFRRNRYPISARVPIGEVIELYHYLKDWSFRMFEDSGNRQQSLLVLSEQAKRIEELLQALPEQQLSYLELERIVRTIYEPSPVLFRPQEVGFAPFVHHAAAFLKPVDQLVWWNFTQAEPNHFFSRWYQAERETLAKSGVELDKPKEENARLIWQRRQPVLHTQQQLILVIPEQVSGKAVAKHPLYSDLEAAFTNLKAISLKVDDKRTHELLSASFQLPKFETLPMQQLGTPNAFIQLPTLANYLTDNKETYTSLDNCLYYPYQWVFKYKSRLKKSSILSVVKDQTLLGNLAHRFFERLLKEEEVTHWTKLQIESWIDDEAKQMFGQEGAALLMYGREPEKINFLNRIKYAAWSLIDCLHRNGWTVHDTEMSMEGQFGDCELRGKADLVLSRGEEFAVVDLKWRGLGYRERMIKNQEDLQLVMYAHLLGQPTEYIHTAYFIIERGQMIARDNAAFAELNALQGDMTSPQIHELIAQRMQATYTWRNKQLRKGFVEVRCEQTLPLLPDAFDQHGLEEESLDILEMKSEDARFDDYRVLINMVS